MYTLREPVTKLIISWSGSLVKLNKGGTFVIKEDDQATSVQLVCGRKHKFFSKTLVNWAGSIFSTILVSWHWCHNFVHLENFGGLSLHLCKQFAFHDLVLLLTQLPPALGLSQRPWVLPNFAAQNGSRLP